ncbi:MAG: Ig-like domain-containing protein [Bacteroidales bacterium]|nr:Ig-like domain-containing protein [Bacteroidales bacterium]
MKKVFSILALGLLTALALVSCKKEGPGNENGNGGNSGTPATAIALNPSSLELAPGGEPVTLTVVVTPEGAAKPSITWSSDHTNVATVANGVVTPVAAGQAVITATAGELSATCTVVVKAPGAPDLPNAPDLAGNYISAQFPTELAVQDNVTYEGWVNAREVSTGLKTFMGVENMFLVRWEGSKLMVVGGETLNESTGALTGEYKYTWSGNFPLNSWHHIAASYERNGQVKLYLDGDVVAEGTAPDHAVYLNGTGDDNVPLGGRTFFIGAAYDTRYFNGYMSHLRVWNKVLSPEEIVEAANNKALASAEGLLANWPLNEGEGNYFMDYSGNQVDAFGNTEPAWLTPVTLPNIVKATAIGFKESEISITRGEEKVLELALTPADAITPLGITWSSDNSAVATVTDGKLQAKTVGEANITVTAGELTATCHVTVTGLTGKVAPSLTNNYFYVATGFGQLANVTIEWKMRANTFQAPTVSSVFGREGQFLIRIGDEGIGLNELQLATNHGNWTTGVTFNADQWYHVALTYSVGNGAILYVDGEKKAENLSFATANAQLTSSAPSNSTHNNSVYIGASYFTRTGSYGNYKWPNDRYFDGEMCEIRVWDVVRTEQEIKDNMNGFEGTHANLKAYWKMDLSDANNGEGNTITDHSGNGKNITADQPIMWKQIVEE